MKCEKNLLFGKLTLKYRYINICNSVLYTPNQIQPIQHARLSSYMKDIFRIAKARGKKNQKAGV